jgi:trimethylamine--corrinoid protein Co-methyltransferase
MQPTGCWRRPGSKSCRTSCLDIYAANGCKVDRATRLVRIDRATVEHFVALAPQTFQLHARNPDRNTVIGGNTINFNTVGSPPNINDLDKGRRPGSYDDLVRLVKLNHSLGVAHMMGGSIVEPMDLPVPTRHLDNAYALLRYTDRPAFVRTASPSSGPWMPSKWCDCARGQR